MKKNWSDILDALRHMLPEGKFKIFLEPLKGRLVQLAPERESAQGLLVAAPSYEWELRLTAANDFMASQYDYCNLPVDDEFRRRNMAT